MKLYILDNGWIECDQNWMVAMSVHGRINNKTPQTNWIRIPVYSVLIDHLNGKILYDLGCHPEAMNGHWPKGLKSGFPYYYNENQDFIKQLALTGTKPEDVKTVVLSHMHMDHAGNLHLFKHANVYVHRKDFEYGQALVNSTTDSRLHGGYVKADLEVEVKNYTLIDEDFELTSGVNIVTLPGHTPGVLGLVVSLEKEGTFIFPQDAVNTSDNYTIPPKASSIIYDSIAYFNSIEKIRTLETKHNAKVMFSHDMEFFKSLKLAPSFYE